MSAKQQNRPSHRGNASKRPEPSSASKRPETSSTAEPPIQNDPLICFVRRIHGRNPAKAMEVCRLIDRHIFSLQSFLQSSGIALSRDIDNQFGKDMVPARELWHLLFEAMRFPRYLFRDGAPLGATTFDPFLNSTGPNLPMTLPVAEATQPTVEDAEAFLNAVKVVFPPTSEVYRHMISTLCELKNGNTDLDDVYDNVMFMLGNRDDLKKTFVRLLPFYRTHRERQAALALLMMPNKTEEKYVDQSKE